MTSRTSLLVSTMLATVLVVGTAHAADADAQRPPPAPGSPAAGTPGVSPPGITPGVGAGASTNPTGAAVLDDRMQSGPDASRGSDNLISEIVVTAEKREQSLQQVPVAVSAFTAEKRDLIGIQSIVDQTNYTPGLTYQPSLDRLSLRGIGRLSNAHAVDSGTAIYVDGVFTTSTFEAGRDPLFVERTEILRGPQGTLYGRNAIGGAYNVISKMPTRELSGEARVTVANYDRQEVAGRLSGPITDWLRFSVGYQKILQGDGFVKNYSGAPGLRFTTTDGVRDQDYFEGQLAGEVGKLDFWVYYSKNQWNDSAPPGTVTNSGTLAPDEINPYFGSGSLLLTPVASYGFTGGLNTQFYGPFRTADIGGRVSPFASETNVAFKNTLHENDIARTHLTYHFDNFDVKYIGGFERYNYFFTNDTDQTSITSYQIPLAANSPCARLQAAGLCQPLTVFPSVYNTYREDEEFYSHEINIASTWDSPLQYIAGLYYYHEKFEYPINVYQPQQPQVVTPIQAVAPTTLAAANPNHLLLHNDDFFSVSSKAAFAQIDYKIVPQLKLTGGVRYTSDEKKGVEEQRAICFALPQCFGGAVNPSQLGSLLGTNGIPALGIGAVPGSIDITLAQATLTPAQIAQVLTTGKTAAVNQQGVISYTYNAATGNLRRQDQDGWNDVTGTAGVEWTPDRRTLAYAKYSRGYKSGALRILDGVTGTFSQTPYAKPEQANDFEAGLKKDWTRRIQTNIAGFYEIYYDAQFPLSIPQAVGPNIGIFYNIPRSVVQGVELETVFAPIDKLNINFTYAYLDAHITRGGGVLDPNDPLATQRGARPDGGGVGVDSFTGLPNRTQNLKGNALPLSPKNKLALNGNYTFDLGQFGSLIGSASYIWRDQQYSSIFNRFYNLSPSTDQIDLRLTYKEPHDRFEVIGYARNVTNNTNFETLSGTRYSTSQVYQTYLVQDPRTYGVQFQARF